MSVFWGKRTVRSPRQTRHSCAIWEREVFRRPQTGALVSHFKETFSGSPNCYLLDYFHYSWAFDQRRMPLSKREIIPQSNQRWTPLTVVLILTPSSLAFVYFRAQDFFPGEKRYTSSRKKIAEHIGSFYIEYRMKGSLESARGLFSLCGQLPYHWTTEDGKNCRYLPETLRLPSQT